VISDVLQETLDITNRRDSVSEKDVVI